MSTETEHPGHARRLADDHRRLQQIFDDLCARARGGDWHDLDQVWDGFAADLEDHFTFEETMVFPAFAQRGAHCRRVVSVLVREHAEIRRLLEELGLQIQLHEIRAATVEALVDRLRAHAELEDLEVYPWADLHRPREDSSTRHPAS
jgi:iron-sulfur cluster repair protein YtfE (RIC family)